VHLFDDEIDLAADLAEVDVGYLVGCPRAEDHVEHGGDGRVAAGGARDLDLERALLQAAFDGGVGQRRRFDLRPVHLAAGEIDRQPHLPGQIALGVIVLSVAQLCAGAINLALLAPIGMQIVHLLLADLLWIALVLLTVQVPVKGIRNV